MAKRIMPWVGKSVARGVGVEAGRVGCGERIGEGDTVREGVGVGVCVPDWIGVVSVAVGEGRTGACPKGIHLIQINPKNIKPIITRFNNIKIPTPAGVRRKLHPERWRRERGGRTGEDGSAEKAMIAIILA
jgi:hypothetical protein